MKKWEKPKVFNLGVQYTFGSQNNHYCHAQKGDCSDFNGPEDNGPDHNHSHSIPNWNLCKDYTVDFGEAGHTCCCSELIAPES